MCTVLLPPNVNSIAVNKYVYIKIMSLATIKSTYVFTLLLSDFKQISSFSTHFNLLKSTGYIMHHQFNIQQMYVLPTLYLCVLYLSENKQRLVPLTA